jgi:hypothetical protein
MAAQKKSWLGELWRPLAALLLWAVGIVAAHAAPPLLPSLAETRIGGLQSVPQVIAPADLLLSLDLHRACGPPLYDLAADCSVAANRVAPLGRGSTADLAKGTTLPRNLREQLGVEQAMSRPGAGDVLPIKMTDSRWPSSDGWVKMQQTVQSGGREGPINVHYVFNQTTGAVDDFKIVVPGPR